MVKKVAIVLATIFVLQSLVLVGASDIKTLAKRVLEYTPAKDSEFESSCGGTATKKAYHRLFLTEEKRTTERELIDSLYQKYVNRTNERVVDGTIDSKYSTIVFGPPISLTALILGCFTFCLLIAVLIYIGINKLFKPKPSYLRHDEELSINELKNIKSKETWFKVFIAIAGFFMLASLVMMLGWLGYFGVSTLNMKYADCAMKGMVAASVNGDVSADKQRTYGINGLGEAFDKYISLFQAMKDRGSGFTEATNLKSNDLETNAENLKTAYGELPSETETMMVYDEEAEESSASTGFNDYVFTKDNDLKKEVDLLMATSTGLNRAGMFFEKTVTDAMVTDVKTTKSALTTKLIDVLKSPIQDFELNKFYRYRVFFILLIVFGSIMVFSAFVLAGTGVLQTSNVYYNVFAEIDSQVVHLRDESFKKTKTITPDSPGGNRVDAGDNEEQFKLNPTGAPGQQEMPVRIANNQKFKQLIAISACCGFLSSVICFLFTILSVVIVLYMAYWCKGIDGMMTEDTYIDTYLVPTKVLSDKTIALLKECIPPGATGSLSTLAGVTISDDLKNAVDGVYALDAYANNKETTFVNKDSAAAVAIKLSSTIKELKEAEDETYTKARDDLAAQIDGLIDKEETCRAKFMSTPIKEAADAVSEKTEIKEARALQAQMLGGFEQFISCRFVRRHMIAVENSVCFSILKHMHTQSALALALSIALMLIGIGSFGALAIFNAGEKMRGGKRTA